MTPSRHIAIGFCIALGAVCGGCLRHEAPPSDLGAACRAACDRRMVPRTVEQLEELAGIHLGRGQQAARLEAASGEDYSGNTAENDPRFNRMLEAELCSLMVFSSRQGETLERRIEPAVREMLCFEQRVLWAKFALLKPRPAEDRERRECILALELTTGWSPERIEAFDFSSLAVPRAMAKRSVGSGDAELGEKVRTALRTAAELLLLDSQTAPERAMIAAKMEELRTARVALAEHYLRSAEAAHAAAPGAETLRKWRIAAARCAFEKSIPRCMGGDKWNLN